MTRDRLEALLRRPGAHLGAALLLSCLLLLGWRACARPDSAERGDTRFYVRGAERFLAGQDLYWAERLPDGYLPTTGYTYPPPFAAACAWTPLLPYRVVRGLWLLGMTACALAAGWLGLRLLAAAGVPPARPALSLALVLPLALRFGLNDLAHGQTNWLLTLLLAAALLSAPAAPGRAGLALGGALAIKPTAWPLLVWWLLVERRWRAGLAALGALGGLLLLVPLPRYGPGGTLELLGGWLELMGDFARAEAAAPGNASLSATLYRLGGGRPDAAPGAGLLVARGAALLGGAGCFAWLALRRRSAPGAPAALLALGALLSPVTWKAHLVALLLPALFAARRLADDPAPSARHGLLWAATLGLLVLPSRGLLGLGRLEELGSVALGVALVLCQAARPESPSDTLVAPASPDSRSGVSGAP